MASDWRTFTIGELCEQFGGQIQTGPFGSQLHAHDYETDGDVPVVPTSAIGRRRLNPDSIPRISRKKADELGRHYLRPGDILFARRGAQAAGLSALVEPEHDGWLCGTGAILLRFASNQIDPTFLSFALAREESYEWIRRHAIGATMPNLNEQVVRSVPVPLPPIEEQRRIAAVLGALDDKIELNRKMNRTLEEMAQALFKSWFIDFDGHEDLVDSELGPIPRGWSVGTLGDFIRIRRGLSYKGAHLTDHGTPMVNLKCIMSGGGFRHDGLKHYDGPFKEKHVVRPGDLVIANTDLTQAREVLGCPAIVPRLSSEPIIASHHIYITEPASSLSLPNAFLYYLLKSPQLRDRCQGFASGTTVLAITPDVIEQAPFVVPPAKKAQEFVVLADALHLRMSLNHEESRTLSALRDLLLPKLISGELRVPESLPLP